MAYVVFIKPEKARVLDRQLTYASSLSLYLSLITLAVACLSSVPWGQKCLCELALWYGLCSSRLSLFLPSHTYMYIVRVTVYMLNPCMEHDTNLKPFLIYYVMLALALDLRALILINIHTHTHTHTHTQQWTRPGVSDNEEDDLFQSVTSATLEILGDGSQPTLVSWLAAPSLSLSLFVCPSWSLSLSRSLFVNIFLALTACSQDCQNSCNLWHVRPRVVSCVHFLSGPTECYMLT